MSEVLRIIREPFLPWSAVHLGLDRHHPPIGNHPLEIQTEFVCQK